VVGVRTTRAIARGAWGAVRVPVVDAHKGEVFVAAYVARDDGTLASRLDETHGAPELVAPLLRAALGDSPFVLVGSGLALYRDRLLASLAPAATTIAPRAYDAPRGALIALEAEEALAARGPDDLATLEPLYVRASDAVLPAPRS
jgi:tRNA A37 threonylcarbamoyladenosine modification protein TsaB